MLPTKSSFGIPFPKVAFFKSNCCSPELKCAVRILSVEILKLLIRKLQTYSIGKCSEKHGMCVCSFGGRPKKCRENSKQT